MVLKLSDMQYPTLVPKADTTVMLTFHHAESDEVYAKEYLQFETSGDAVDFVDKMKSLLQNSIFHVESNDAM